MSTKYQDKWVQGTKRRKSSGSHMAAWIQDFIRQSELCWMARRATPPRSISAKACAGPKARNDGDSVRVLTTSSVIHDVVLSACAQTDLPRGYLRGDNRIQIRTVRVYFFIPYGHNNTVGRMAKVKVQPKERI